MSIMMKKGISKEYEVESLILNEENVDKLYGNFLKDLKSKIEFCFANEKVLYFLINGEKINDLSGEKINDEIIEKFKRDKFLDLHLIFQETFCQKKEEKIIRKTYNWFFNENDIFINDPIKNITDANHIENRNNYSFLYTGKDFNSNITYPVYEYTFQHNYYIKDNKVFSRENSLNFEYLKLDNITNLYYYLDNFLGLRKRIIDFAFLNANQEVIEEINEKSKNDLFLKELLIFEYLKDCKFRINGKIYTFETYIKFMNNLVENFKNDGYLQIENNEIIKKNSYLVKLESREFKGWKKELLLDEELFKKISKEN